MSNTVDVKLSKNEEKILMVLWDAGEALPVSEICKHAAGMNVKLNANTVQVFVKKMMDKGVLEVGHITQVNTVLARAYKPSMTADELTSKRISLMLKASPQKKVGLIANFLQDEEMTKNELDELAAVIEELKNR